MPQMMPINWMLIFFMCLMCLFIIMILMNSFLMYFHLKKNKNLIYKKWTWLW
nr:TPA_asm: ATP8 [Bombus soroeensis]